MTETSEVVLSMPIVSLPVGGTMTRMACGRMIRRIVSIRVRPRALAASCCPWSTERIPARTISDMYAASLSPSPRIAATVGEINWLASSATPGSPRVITGYRAARLYQKSNWTRTGVPRKAAT